MADRRRCARHCVDRFHVGEKDIVSIYSTMPKEQVLPLIATTLAVSLLKVAVLAGAILLIKWVIGKWKK